MSKLTIIYIVLYFFWSLLTVLDDIAMRQGLRIVILEILSSVFAISGMISFYTRNHFINSDVWKTLLVFIVIWEIYSAQRDYNLFFQESDKKLFFLGSILYLPCLYMIYNLAFDRLM